MNSINVINSINRIYPICPVCNQTIVWYNDIPLKGFCWGTAENEHNEYSVTVNTSKPADNKS